MARDAPVTVFKRVDGYEPEVADTSPQNEIRTIVTVEPVEKGRHFPRQSNGGGSFKMDMLVTDRTRDKLHRPFRVVAPGSDLDFAHPAVSCWKERSMPAEQSFLSQGFVIVLRCVEHHLNHTLDVSAYRHRHPDIHAQTPGDGGAHLRHIEHLPFDLRGFQDIQRQGVQNGFSAQRKPQRLHPSDQSPLPVTHGGNPTG